MMEQGETENWYYEANKKALKQLGLNLQMDEYQEIMARGGTAWELAINAGITTEIIDKKRVQRDNYYQEFLHTKNLEIPNVKKVLKNLSKNLVNLSRTLSRFLVRSPVGEKRDTGGNIFVIAVPVVAKFPLRKAFLIKA